MLRKEWSMGQYASHEIIPFKSFVNQRMTTYQVGLPLLISFVISILIGVLILIQYTDSNKTFVESIAPHVSSLLETQDRPEIQRFIKSVSTKQGTPIEVISDNEVIASSLDPSRIGESFIGEPKKLPFLELYKNEARFISFADVRRVNGPQTMNAKVGIYLNTNSIIYVTLGISISAFLFSLLIINWIISKVVKESQRSLAHLNELENAIRKIQNDFNEKDIPSFQIQELENIRHAFLDTQSKLQESNDKIARSKARDMATYAYKNLIHDLHVPVSALRNHLKILSHERANEETKRNAMKRIVDLAEQVLKQVKSAKSNLGFEITLTETDLVESVKKATDNAYTGSLNESSVKVKTQFPIERLVKAHDPILLSRALGNLITNAIEAAKTQVQIDLEAQNNAVSIKVSDDGGGMNQEDVSLHLQGRGKSTKSERMGIGLASANHIIRSHGGKIIYQKSPLGGACFEIKLQEESV